MCACAHAYGCARAARSHCSVLRGCGAAGLRCRHAAMCPPHLAPCLLHLRPAGSLYRSITTGEHPPQWGAIRLLNATWAHLPWHELAAASTPHTCTRRGRGEGGASRRRRVLTHGGQPAGACGQQQHGRLSAARAGGRVQPGGAGRGYERHGRPLCVLQPAAVRKRRHGAHVVRIWCRQEGGAVSALYCTC